jgi:hypothetical protein
MLSGWPGESEEQFVARAKQAIRDVLLKRFKEIGEVSRKIRKKEK